MSPQTRNPHVLTAARILVALALGPAPWLVSLSQRPLALAPATAQLDAEFTRVTAVRELGDGRLLVVDAGENRIVVADFVTGATRAIGRSGGGTDEYRTVRTLFPLGADSSLIPDGGNGRWLLLVRDSIAAMVSADQPAVRALGSALAGLDARGAVVGTVPRRAGGIPRLDSLMVLRAWRGTARVDTLGSVLARRPSFPSGARVDPSTPVAVTFNPLAVAEQVVMFADGWIAVARLAPYRVEWISPEGQRTEGPQLPFDALRVDDREKRFVLAREALATGRPPREAADVGDWPSVVPAFLNSSLLAAADGSVWIGRTPSSVNAESRYDVVDRRGALIRRIVLPLNQRVVAVTASAVYTIVTDEDGVERVRRHPGSRFTNVPTRVTPPPLRPRRQSDEVIAALPDLEPLNVAESLRHAAEAVHERELPISSAG